MYIANSRAINFKSTKKKKDNWCAKERKENKVKNSIKLKPYQGVKERKTKRNKK